MKLPRSLPSAHPACNPRSGPGPLGSRRLSSSGQAARPKVRAAAGLRKRRSVASARLLGLRRAPRPSLVRARRFGVLCLPKSPDPHVRNPLKIPVDNYVDNLWNTCGKPIELSTGRVAHVDNPEVINSLSTTY